jgi:putative transposase
MSQPPHFEIDGAIYFITTRLQEGQRLLDSFESGIVQKNLLDLSSKKEIVLYAFVVMPDHLHALLKPIMNGISKTMQLIKGRTAREINIQRAIEAKGEAKASPAHDRVNGFSSPTNFWQKGYFDFTVITENKFKEKFNYIHYNPVKRGLVEKAEDYIFSSAKECKERYGEVFYA